MGNRFAQVTKVEIERSLKGAQAAGLRIARVEVDHRRGVVSLIPEGAADDASANPCDRLLK